MSIIDTTTVNDFKDLFYRDFEYADIYDSLATYNVNDVVFYNRKFYKCIVNNTTNILPTVNANWILSASKYVLDKDITEAFIEGKMNFRSVFPTDEAMQTAYLYLTAHYLVTDLNMGGLDSASVGLLSSRSVGSVSESYTIPSYMMNGLFAMFSQTKYGQKYVSLLYPYMALGSTLLVSKI
jgi:hypothetical protein